MTHARNVANSLLVVLVYLGRFGYYYVMESAPTSFNLPRDLVQRIDETAARAGISRSALVRMVLFVALNPVPPKKAAKK